MTDLEIKLHRVILKPDVKGRKTLPTVGLNSKAFAYTPAIKTDLSETFKRARASIGVRRVEKAA